VGIRARQSGQTGSTTLCSECWKRLCILTIMSRPMQPHGRLAPAGVAELLVLGQDYLNEGQ
jgi:hypothetical protein